jgi:hypothetical protein
MPELQTKRVRLPDELARQVDEFCAENGITFSAETRRLWSRRIGVPVPEVKRGRPVEAEREDGRC